MLRSHFRFNPLLRPEEDWSDLPPILRPDPPVAPPQPARLSVPGWPPPAHPRMPSIFGLDLMPAPAPDANYYGRRAPLLEAAESLLPHRPTPPSLFGTPSPFPVPSHGTNILLGPDEESVQPLTASNASAQAAPFAGSLLDPIWDTVDAVGKAASAAWQDVQDASGYTRGQDIAAQVTREAMAEAARRAGADPNIFLEALDGLQDRRLREKVDDSLSKALQEAGGDAGAFRANIHNGPLDAWRHAEWSRRMAEEIDPVRARLFGFGHEVENLWNGYRDTKHPDTYERTRRESFQMDEPNNIFGVRQRGQGPIPFDHPGLTYFRRSDPFNPTVGPGSSSR
jgi:hypothetical protein